jgi:hypothetical protein
VIRPLLACLLVAASRAETVSWFSDPGAVNLDSTGAPMNAGFQFQLGAFTGTFVPTASNAAGWSAHWVAAATTGYAAATGLYDAQFTLEDNAAPFSVNGKAWIWGFRNTASGSEWILFRAASWKWPVANPFNPPLIQWNARDADEVVLGTIHAAGSPFLMRSAAVKSYSQWVATELEGHALAGADDDPDGDGVTNRFEFVFGTPPLGGGPRLAPLPGWYESGGQRYLQLTVPRRRDRLAHFSVEVSDNLAGWQTGGMATVDDEAGAWTVRDLMPQEPSQPRRFLRFRAVLP